MMILLERVSRRGGLGRQFAWLSAGRIAAAVILGAQMLIMVRAVSPAEFGFFAAVYGLIVVPQTLLDFGLPSVVIKRRAISRDDGRVTAALKFSNQLSLILALVLALSALFAGLFWDPRCLYLLPLAFWAAAERNADTWLGVVFADGDIRITTVNLVLRRAINLGLFSTLALMAGMNAMLAFSASSAIAAAGSWVFAHAYVVKRLPTSDGSTTRSLIVEGWPYWVNSVANQIRNVDTALTSGLAGVTQAGYYAAASRLTNPLRILPASLASLLLPASAKLTAKTVTPLLKLIGLFSGVIAVFFITLFIVIPYVVPPILGLDYSGSIPALRITAIGLIFTSAASLLATPLQGLGLQHYVATVAVATSGLCLVGVALGALFYGAKGASIGLAFSYVVQFVLFSIRLRQFVVRTEPNR